MFKSIVRGLISNPFVENALKNQIRAISITTTKHREVVNRKEMLKTVPKLDEGTVGERSADVDSIIYR